MCIRDSAYSHSTLIESATRSPAGNSGQSSARQGLAGALAAQRVLVVVGARDALLPSAEEGRRLKEALAPSADGAPKYALDLTAGNGHDTLRLAQLLCCSEQHSAAGEAHQRPAPPSAAAPPPPPRVHAFDVQRRAVEATRTRLEAHLPPGAARRVARQA